MLELYQPYSDFSFIKNDDMEVISTPIDFLGINYYSCNVIQYDESNEFKTKHVIRENVEVTDMNWAIYPSGIYDIIERINREYTTKDIYITENGAAFPDIIEKDGRVHDQKRIDYLEKHFSYLHKAIEKGLPLKGYYLWSLMDNFEWGFGFSKRFGIVHIDYQTLKRTIKESGYWYQKVIANHSL